MGSRICVVGAGRWGMNHVRALEELGHLAGIVESDPERLEDLRERCPDARLFADLDEALGADFDGFTVATPAQFHYPIATRILSRKKPVLVEKPIALTAEDARRLKRCADENGVTLMVGHVLLFHPAIRKIKELIQAGKIGRLQYLYSNRLNLGTVRTEENILWSFAPHDVAIFQHLIGSVPNEVRVQGAIFLQPDIHDTTITTLEYPDNVHAHVFLSWLHPFKEHRLVVIGSKGMLSFEDSSEAKEILFYEKGIDWVRGEPVAREGPTAVIDYEMAMPLTLELAYFVEHLSDPAVEIADGAHAVEVMEILERASKSLLASESPSADVPKRDTTASYYIHPSSYVDPNVEIGEGTKIWHFCHVQSNVKIGRHCSFGQNVNVAGNVRMGNFVKIQDNVSVYEGVELEDYVFCGPSMVFTNIKAPRSRYPQRGSEYYVKTRVRKGATIGANATIVCGCTVGRHAFVGAGAVISKDVPEYALMVGVPARQIGWVCECGTRLPDEGNALTCPRCSLTYSLSEGCLRPTEGGD